MQFTATIALGVAPLMVFGATAVLRPAPPPPIVPKVVATEGVRSVRMDSRAFHDRWTPAYEFPPTIELRRQTAESSAGPVVLTPQSVPPVRRLHARPARLDVCARHGMRRVDYRRNGYMHWRCRK